MAKKDYTNWDRKELIKEIDQLRKRKKYGLVWENKPENVVEQCKTELPVLKEIKSKEIITDPEKPVNLLIEGDNYHALSVLNYTHKGKIDVIYIDPPYNTGARNWKYNNDYVDKEDAYRHSKFICFMQNRLVLAKKLLSNKGIIICAIDDYEVHNVRHLMDDIFDENNRLGSIVVVHNPRGRNDDRFLATMHEYLLVYAKNKDNAEIHHFELNQEQISAYNKKDDISYYNETSFMRTGNNSLREERPNLYYPIYLNTKDNNLQLEKKMGYVELLPVNGKGEHRTWRWGKETFLEKKDTELFVKKVKGEYRIYKKRRLTDIQGTKPKTVWADSKYDASSSGIMLLQKMFDGANPFSYPKSIHAVRDIINITSGKDSTVLDFFAGSGTTGQAVLELNKIDGGKRKFIISTNNELNGEETKLREQGLSEKEIQAYGICQAVTYPRMRKVIDGYSNIKGIPANLKYYKTAFVPADPTDKNKIALTEKVTEMLCIKEDTFEEVKITKQYKVFRNKKRYTGIVFDHQVIDDFKKEIAKINGKFSLYIFSLGDDAFEEEFEDMKKKVKLSPIPEAILRVYRRIFK